MSKNDTSNVKKESTVYGTVSKIEAGQVYVKLDGATGAYTELPVSETVEVIKGDRVIVTIKNHAAIITSNLDRQSVSQGAATVTVIHKNVTDLTNSVVEMGTVLSDKVDTKDLTATNGRVETLETDVVTVNKKLKVAEETLTKKLTADEADLKYAQIGTLESIEIDVGVLYSDNINIKERLTAAEGRIEELGAVNLEAVNGEITNLKTRVGDIETITSKVITTDNITSEFSNSVISQVGDAQIKSAQIQNIDASKIQSGSIDTNKVDIKSNDGSFVIADNRLQIKEGDTVRVQIGKDGAGNYSVTICDKEGNVIFSEDGITENGIPDNIIVNDMVSETANIHASKLDIVSLFEEIDGSTNTIKSTKITVDDEGQTLEAKLTTLATTESVDGLSETVTSQGTQIAANTEAINTKIWQQDIDTAKNEIGETTTELSTKYSELEQSLSGFQTTVSETYATKTEVDNIKIGGRNLFGFNKNVVIEPLANTAYARNTFDKSINGFVVTILADAPNAMIIARAHRLGFNGVAGESYTFSSTVYTNGDSVRINMDICDRGNTTFTVDNNPKKITFTAIPENYYDNGSYNGFVDVAVYGTEGIPSGTILYFKDVKIERGNMATDWTPAPEDLTGKDEYRAIETRVSQTETDITSVANRTTVVEDKFNNYSTTEQMNSIINQTAEGINSTVATVRTEVKNLEVGGRNLLLGTSNTLLVDNTTDFAYSEKTVMYTLCEEITNDPKAFLLSIENSYLVFSYDINVSEIYKNPDKTLNRAGGYFTFNFTNTETGAMTAWYGTHSSGISATSNVFGTGNSLFSVGDEVVSFKGHYAGYCVMSANEGPTILRSFYANPDQYTVTVSKAYLELRGYTKGGTIKNAKLEIGNKPTRWSPAPEDMTTNEETSKLQTSSAELSSRVTTAESHIEQISHSITMLVTDGNGTSLMTQTDTGWVFSTENIQNTVNRISEDLSTLSDDVGDVDNTVSILQQAVDDLGILGEYIQITTYEDEPCIELGELDSDFKLRITNTRMMFTEGSVVLAYFTNQSFHSKKVVVEEELQQGGFVWKARANGNLGLIWKGGNS